MPDKRGRPPLDPDEAPARVHVTVPSRDYDLALKRAEQEGVSIPELVRRGLTRVLAEPPKGDRR
jgi:hypothetical protein